MSRGLLENLADRMGILYLSDLRMTCCWDRLAQQLAAVSAGEYSLAEWRDAIQYLLGKNEGSFRDGDEARDYLVEQLKK